LLPAATGAHIFEADMIFAIVAHHALKGRPVTLKELAT